MWKKEGTMKQIKPTTNKGSPRRFTLKGKGWEEEWEKLLQTNEVYRDVLGKWGAKITKSFIQKLLEEERGEVIEQIRAKLLHPNSPGYNDYWKYLDDFLSQLNKRSKG